MENAATSNAIHDIVPTMPIIVRTLPRINVRMLQRILKPIFCHAFERSSFVSLKFFGAFGRRVCAGVPSSIPITLNSVASVQARTVAAATITNDKSKPGCHFGNV